MFFIYICTILMCLCLTKLNIKLSSPGLQHCIHELLCVQQGGRGHRGDGADPGKALPHQDRQHAQGRAGGQPRAQGGQGIGQTDRLGHAESETDKHTMQ